MESEKNDYGIIYIIYNMNIINTKNSHLDIECPSGVKIAFFGTPEFAVQVLEELKKAGILPRLVVAAPDKPKGRKMVLTPPPAKIWAKENGVPVEQPERVSEIAEQLEEKGFNLFAVAAYGKIIPKKILDIPEHGTLNVHPSLLPRLRGASPVQSAILRGEDAGVTIMLMDEKMDHGPILAAEKLKVKSEGFYREELEEKLAETGGRLLAKVIPEWTAGKIEPKEQEHGKATYCEKIAKKDGLISPEDSPQTILRKVRAFTPWPGAYFIANGKRIIVTAAEIEKGKLAIKRVKPEGKKEMPLEDYLKGNKGREKFLPALGARNQPAKKA